MPTFFHFLCRWTEGNVLVIFSFFILILSGCLGENDYIRCRNTYRKGGK